MSRRLAPIASFAFTLLTLALLALVLLGPGSGAAAEDLAPATSAPVFTAIAEQPAEVEEAFIADLFGPDTDVAAEQATLLAELAQRYCDKVVTGAGTVPGAEVQTREGWIETLTMGEASPTTGWSAAEANKFLDTAAATYCPTLFGQPGAEQDASL